MSSIISSSLTSGIGGGVCRVGISGSCLFFGLLLSLVGLSPMVCITFGGLPLRGLAVSSPIICCCGGDTTGADTTGTDDDDDDCDCCGGIGADVACAISCAIW